MNTKIFKQILVLLFICPIFIGKSQIKLGNNVTTINSSSLLELESTSKGLLFTRMTTTQMNAISAVQGLVVFNTDSNCLFNHNGTSWISLCRTGISSLNGAWLTTGNSSSGGKYLGTSNNSDLVIKTNGSERMRIDSATGNVGIGTNNPINTLSIYGGISIGKCDSVDVTADNQSVTVGNNSTIFLKSNNSTATQRTIILSDGLVMGQILILINIDRDANDGVEVRDNTNTKLNGNWQSDNDDSLILMWNGIDWIQLSESAN